MKKLRQSFALVLFGTVGSGFLLALFLNVLSYFNRFTDAYSIVLHVGMLACIPSIILSINETKELFPKEKSNFFIFKILPKWLTVLGIILLVYALANAFFIDYTHFTITKLNHHFLQNYFTKVTFEISEEEFVKFKITTLKGFSAIWLAVYFWSVVLLGKTFGEWKKTA